MVKYFFNRILLVIPTFLGITLLIFALTRFVPGGPLEEAIRAQMMGQGGEGGRQLKGADRSGNMLSEAQMDQLKAFYGLDKPVVPAYVEWLGKLLRFDFGKSTRFGDPVIEMIVQRVPISLWFGVTSLILTYLISIPLGIAKALRHRKPFDNVSSALLFFGYALPGFIVGIILLTVFSFGLGWLPIGGFQSKYYMAMGFFEKIWDRVTHMALPLTAYVIGDFAVLTIVMKNNLMENMAADYVKTAVAKGMTFKDAMWKHAFRNSLIPIAAGFGGIISVFLAGSFLIENIFNIRGMGMLGYTSLTGQDYPVVLGVLAISSFVSLIGNILSDFFVSLVDPRVRFGRKA
ncbi:MAG: ABC transporter permease subunit [Spirochaetia bacterium]|nr:ABC transporter permease subunit [Spirochaetia bacterium]